MKTNRITRATIKMENPIYKIENDKIIAQSREDYVFEASSDQTTASKGVAPRLFVESLDYDDEQEYYFDDLRESYTGEEMYNMWHEGAEDKDGNPLFHDEKQGQTAIFTISLWGVTGSKYHREHNLYATREAAEAALFEIWEQNAIDNSNYNFYGTLEEAVEAYAEKYDIGEEVVEFLFDEDLLGEYIAEYLKEYTIETLILLKHKDLLDDDEFISEKINPEMNLEEIMAQIAEYEKEIEAEKIRMRSIKQLEDELVTYYASYINPKEESYRQTAKRLNDAIGYKVQGKIFHRAVKLIRSRYAK